VVLWLSGLWLSGLWLSGLWLSGLWLSGLKGTVIVKGVFGIGFNFDP